MQRQKFYRNLSANIGQEGPKFGLTGQQCTDAKALVDDMLAKLKALDDAKAALAAARQLAAQTEAANLAKLRAAVRHWKTLPGYPTSGSEAVLHLRQTAAGFDPRTFQPKIKARTEPGRVRLQFQKKGADRLAFYWRLPGSAEWEKIGEDSNPPFYDSRPLATPGVPEVRDYRARGILNDIEIGEFSNIVTVTFAG